jgi:hypothetical protein
VPLLFGTRDGHKALGDKRERERERDREERKPEREREKREGRETHSKRGPTVLSIERISMAPLTVKACSLSWLLSSASSPSKVMNSL